MLNHIGINVSNLKRSRHFYDSVLAELGCISKTDSSTSASYGVPATGDFDDPCGDFWISEGEPSTPRVHIAFTALNIESVERFYQTAIALGATCNGAPGYRPKYHSKYYAAFVLDLDGYNIEAVCQNSM